TLAIVAVLFTGLAVTSVASSEDFKILRSKYKVEVTGLYENTWQGQTSGYPRSDTPWSQEKGKVTAGFRTVKPWTFVGSKFQGDLPGPTKLPKFQLMAAAPTVTKSKNRAQFKRKINYVAMCGGELGECDGTEKSGVESTSRSCQKPGRVPLDFDFDADGFKPLITVGFGFHQSMDTFCGKKYPGENSITDLKKPFRMKNGVDEIAGLEKGEKMVRVGSREQGWIGGDGHPDGARHVKQCPQMSGVGSRQCWVTDIRIEVKRVK
ncbi:MAG: hypothetical protein M3Y23_01140, partial [Actinomycetota bacterium]|nr:hypothetical protein [Actinomycetota bacterium]